MITRKIPLGRLFQLGEGMPPTSKNTFLEIHINTNTATSIAETRTFLPMVVYKGLSFFLGPRGPLVLPLVDPYTRPQ